MKGFPGWASRDMTSEYRQEGIGFMVSSTLCENFPVGMVEKGKDIHGTVSDVLKFFKAFSGFLSPKIGNQSFEYLNTGAFIKKEKVIRRT